MTIKSNHKYVHFVKTNRYKQNCKIWKYGRFINKENKYWINRCFKTKIEALVYKFIITTRLKAGHNLLPLKRNLWY